MQTLLRWTSNKCYVFFEFVAVGIQHPMRMCLKTNSHIPCRSHAVPLPCRSVKASDCVFPIWFTLCDHVWVTHAMPFPCRFSCRFPVMPQICRSDRDLSRPWQGRGGRMKVCWRHVRDLSAYGLLLLPRPIAGSLLSEAYQSQIAVASVKQSGVCPGGGEAYYFGARTWVLA
jgi:hypothetical protein